MRRIKAIAIFSAFIAAFCCALSACASSSGGNTDGGNGDKPPEHFHAWSVAYTNDGNRHYRTCNGCDEKKYDEHGWDKGEITTPPTCKDHGVKTYTCAQCGSTKTEQVAKITTHTWDNGEITTPSTCKDFGVKTYTCTVCDEIKTEQLAKSTTHSWGSWYDKDEAEHARCCSVCEQTETRPHDFSNGDCVCGKTNDTTHEHVWADTYVKDGNRHYQTCNGCDEKKYGEHGWDNGEITTPPTCKDHGVKTYTCAQCGAIKTEQVEKTTAHTWNSGEITTPPTCKDYGVKTYTCTVCVETKTEQVEKITTHTWNDGEITTPPTCKDYGVKTYTCVQCGATKKVQVERTTTHTWNSGEITKPPTCKDYGVKTYTCTVCVETKTEQVEKSTTHSWGSWYIKDEAEHIRYCSVCKQTLTGAHDYTDGDCVCGSSAPRLSFMLNPDGFGYSVVGIGTIDSSEIIIPSEYNGKPVTGINSGAFSNCVDITSVTISNSVTSIGEHAFYGCDGLKCVTVGSGLIEIAGGAFDNCVNLTDIHISDIASWCGIDGLENLRAAHTSARKLYLNGQPLAGALTIPGKAGCVPDYAFYGCDGLMGVTIENGVTSIGEHAFYGCDGIMNVSISDSVVSIGERAFAETGYHNDEKNRTDGILYIGNFLIDADKYMIGECTIKQGTTVIADNAFRSCNRISSLVIPDSVIAVGKNAFEHCVGLTSVIIGKGVTSIPNGTFANCYGLKSIVIPATVKSIGAHAFNSCGGLQSVTLSDGLTSIGEYAFAFCFDLTSVTIPRSVVEMGSEAFGGTDIAVMYCQASSKPSGWTDGWISSENPIIWDCDNNDKDADGFVYAELDGIRYCLKDGVARVYRHGRNITTANIPSDVSYGGKTYDVKTISDRAFYGCEHLQSVSIPNSVTTIGERAFVHCDGLTSVIIPNSVTVIGAYAFDYCSGLASVTLPVGLTDIGEGAFGYCVGLTSIIIPSAVKNIGGYAFYECSGLTVYCEAASAASGWESDWNISDCPVVWNCKNNDKDAAGNMYASLDGVRYLLKNGVATVTVQPRNITIADIPAAITYNGATYSVTNIVDKAFYRCESLTVVNIPDSVASIGIEAFSGCESLASITMGKSVTSIGEYAFYECRSLTSMTLPSGVTRIGRYAFDECSILILYCEATSAPSGWHASFNSTDCPIVWDCKNNEKDKDGFMYAELDGIRYSLKDGSASVIRQSMFIKTAIMPAEVSYKGATYAVTRIADHAFSGCQYLQSVSVPSSVTVVGYCAFNGCDSLQHTLYGNALYIGNESNPYYVLLSSVDGDIASCTIHDDTRIICAAAFSFCHNLKSVTIPKSVTYIGDGAFRGCQLKNITAESGNTRYISSGNCLIDTVTDTLIYACADGAIPSDGSVTVIGEYAFHNYNSLIEIILPDGVTHIAAHAFEYCADLARVDLPNSVEFIGEFAFSGCIKLTSITYQGTKSQWSKIQKHENFCDGNVKTIVCTDGVISLNQRL